MTRNEMTPAALWEDGGPKRSLVVQTCLVGTVTVVKAGPKFEEVAVNKLPDRISASPALAGGRIYLRGYDALYAIGPQGK